MVLLQLQEVDGDSSVILCMDICSTTLHVIWQCSTYLHFSGQNTWMPVCVSSFVNLFYHILALHGWYQVSINKLTLSRQIEITLLVHWFVNQPLFTSSLDIYMALYSTLPLNSLYWSFHLFVNINLWYRGKKCDADDSYISNCLFASL